MSMHTCACTHSHRAWWESGLAILPLDSPRAMSRTGRERPGSLQPATICILPQGCLLSSALLLTKFQNHLRQWPTLKTSPYPIATTENSKDPSLLRGGGGCLFQESRRIIAPINPLSPEFSLFMGTGKN